MKIEHVKNADEDSSLAVWSAYDWLEPATKYYDNENQCCGKNEATQVWVCDDNIIYADITKEGLDLIEKKIQDEADIEGIILEDLSEFLESKIELLKENQE